MEGIVGISRDYLLQTRASKQPIMDFPGYEIILPIHSNALEVNKA
jgi:hypothetical protein